MVLTPDVAIAPPDACGICGATAFRTLFPTRAPVHWIFQCTSCGLSASKNADGGSVRTFDSDYYRGRYGYMDYEANRPALRRNFRDLLRLIRRYVPSGDLLDIGCAEGYLLDEAAPYFRATGIDNADYYRSLDDAVLQSRNLLCGSIHDLAFPSASFDVVVLYNVMEQVETPLQTFHEVRRVVRPDGLVVFTAPDISSLAARISGRYWRCISPRYHVYYYTRDSIRALLRASGLELVEMRYRWKHCAIREVLHTQLTLFRRTALTRFLERLVRRIPSEWAMRSCLWDVLTVVARPTG